MVSGLHFRSEGLERRLLGVGPEARFLIEAVLRMAVLGARWSGKKDDLARRLRLTKKLVSVGVEDLERADLLTRISAETGRRGRPAVTYEVNGEIRNDLKRLDSPFSPLFDELFLGVERSPDVSQQNSGEVLVGAEVVLKKLKNSALDRLLLAVLLDHANDVGLVVGVSRSDLQRMTGLNGDRVRNRLSTLEKRELVRFHAPGFASARFPGGKVKSGYVLDLGLLPSPEKWIHCEIFDVGGTQFSRAEGGLYTEKTAHESFYVTQGSMLGVWLLVHRFVSDVLTSHKWDGVLKADESVVGVIRSALRADSPNKEDGVDFESLCEQLAEWVANLANCYIACPLGKDVEKGGRISILPYGKRTMRLVFWRVDLPG